MQIQSSFARTLGVRAISMDRKKLRAKNHIWRKPQNARSALRMRARTKLIIFAETTQKVAKPKFLFGVDRSNMKGVMNSPDELTGFF